MIQDLRYALRSLRRHAFITGVAVLTLGLGIGGATAVFSVVDGVLLRPLPFADPDRLVRLMEVTPAGRPFSFSEPTFLDLAAEARTIESVAAYREIGGTTVLTGAGEPRRISAVPISASTMHVLGVRPALGHMFTPEEDRARSAERPLVLSDALWRQQFGGDRAIVGRTLALDGETFVVSGVMPPAFDFPGGAEAWVPLRANRERDRDDKDIAAIARIAPGATLAQVRGELRDFGRRISDAHPKANAGWSVDALRFSDWLIAPRFRAAVWVLFGSVALLLLLTCANVANLLIAQGAARRGEMRIRAALGAHRRRLARQLLTESAVLGVLGTSAGVLIAAWSLDVVHALGDGRVPRLDQVQIDGWVRGFACLAGMISCLAFGLAPAWQGARVDLRAGLDEGTRYSAGSRRLRHGLVMLEVALALMLLVGAGLLAKSFVRLVRVDPGFDPNGVLAMSLEISPNRYPDDRLDAFYADLIERVRAVPGVTAAGATSTDPFRQLGFSNNVTPEDRAADAPPSGLVQAGWRSVTPGFFEAIRLPLLSGRTFSPSDRAGGERVVVITQSLARQLWPDGQAVGRRIFWGGTTGRTRTVVGVTSDFQDVRLDAEPAPMLFVPHAQVAVPGMTIIVRTPLDAGRVAPALRAAVRAIDSGIPLPDVHAISSNRAEAAAGPRFNLALLGAFAVIAVTLAVSGVYAMLAFSVVERRREIAVRLALGASARDIATLLLGSGLAPALAGILAGTAAALAATRVLESLLYDVTPTDPWTFGAAALTLLGSAAIACYLPARLASRLDPLSVLRD